MDDTVAIICNDVELRFSIEDVSPDILKESFELADEPKTLYQCDNNLVIPARKWQMSLKRGCSYYLKISKNSKSVHELQRDEGLGELILNSLIASTAVYCMSHNIEDEQNCKRYLMEQLENHNFEWVIQSKHGENVYIITKEKNAKRIYIAFRGTQNLTDWQYNLQVDRVSSSSSLIPGKFHSGFLQRAQLFPIEKILNDSRYKDTDVIVCGHSLGGAVAAIVAIRLQTERTRYKLNGNIKCITFGAPFFGDAMVRKSIESRHMYHFVCNNDPVPYLLNYAQTMSSVIAGLNAQISSLAQQYATVEGMSYHQRNTADLVAKKVHFETILSKLEPVLVGAIEVASIVYPGMRMVGEAKRIFSIFSDIRTSTTMKQSVYEPIGNFFFLDEQRDLLKSFQSSDRIGVVDHMETYMCNYSKNMKPDAHNLSNYNQLFKNFNQLEIPFECYLTYIDSELQADFYIPIARDVKFLQVYGPVIHSVKLTKVESRDATILRLSCTGLYLFEVVLSSCLFQFNFPFAADKDTTVVKKISMGENVQRVIIEEPFKEDLAVSDHGINLVYVTQYGMCEKVIRACDRRNLVNQSVAQIAWHDSVSLVIRRAIQRGMALSKIKIESGSGSLNRIIEEVKELGEISLGTEAMKDIVAMFNDNMKNFDFILSNEEAFVKVKEFCDKIENYLRSPMEIQAEWSVMQKIVLGLTTAAGTVALGYLAGPGLVMIGLASAASPTAVGVASIFGALVGGAGANAMMREQLTDSAYQNVLKWINQQLLEANHELLEEKTAVQIFDLQDDGSVYSQEKILMLLTDGKNTATTRNASILSKCTETSKQVVEKRIKVIKKIHRIRELFSQQCFIGVVGLQDAGKTTLLQKIWGVGGKTGLFTHTDVPLLYEITPKLLVVDFPGSNSLDYHAKTFSICGAMNNMVIVVIPFSGDISTVVSEEVRNVFSVMRGSDSTKVVLCINKCGLYLERLKDELKVKDSPIEFMKKRFIDKLNEHYENSGTGIIVKENDILFTDWEVGDEKDANDFGISGVETIKCQIRNYLLGFDIYKEGEAGLKKCFEPVHR